MKKIIFSLSACFVVLSANEVSVEENFKSLNKAIVKLINGFEKIEQDMKNNEQTSSQTSAKLSSMGIKLDDAIQRIAELKENSTSSQSELKKVGSNNIEVNNEEYRKLKSFIER